MTVLQRRGDAYLLRLSRTGEMLESCDACDTGGSAPGELAWGPLAALCGPLMLASDCGTPVCVISCGWMLADELSISAIFSARFA